MDGSSPPNGVPRLPLSGDDAAFASADTKWGGVTPELVLVDPELAPAQRLTKHRKAAMSSPEPANTFPEQAQPAAPPAPTQETAEPSMLDVPLGTLIFRAGLLGEEQLEDALQEGMRTGKRLGEVLLERGWLNERDLGRMLAGQKGLPFVDVAVTDVEADALEALTEGDARRQVALPLFYENGQLVIAVGDPSNELVLESLRRTLKTDFQLVVAPHGQLQQVIGDAYAQPAPAAPQEGVPFPEHPAQAQAAAPVEVQPEPQAEPEPEPAFALSPAPEPEPEPQVEAAPEVEPQPDPELEPQPEQKTQPFSGSTPTLLSRMLFPSVRHAAQEADAEAGAAAAEEPEEPEAPVTDEPERPEAAEPGAPAPVEEDYTELELPAIPEMPIPSFDQPAVQEESAPQADPEPSEPAAEVVTEPEPEAAQREPEAAQPEPEAVEHEAAQPEPEAAQPEPEAAQREPEATQPEPDAQASRFSVLVRLRDGETLRIGEFGTADEASASARDAVGQISSAAGDGTWPLFAGRYLSPGTIVSVDLLEDSPGA
jgi:hypothetical protein